MSEASYFDLATGRLTGHTLTASSDTTLALNPPPQGYGAVAGIWDHRTKMVEMPSAEVIDRPLTTITAVQDKRVVTLSNVKLGTVVNVTGDAQESITQDSPDGLLQLQFATAGHYVVSAEQFPEQLYQEAFNT